MESGSGDQAEIGTFWRLLGSNNILTDDICLKFQQECWSFIKEPQLI